MSDLSKKPPPGYAPAYCALYPRLAEVIRRHGYAAAVHGSMQRDFDLICIPWVEEAGEPQSVVDELLAKFDLRYIEGPCEKPHGRTAWTLSIGFGECAVDLQFMPRLSQTPDPTPVASMP